MNPQTIQPESKSTSIPYHKLSAVFYGLWGLWHIQVVTKLINIDFL